MIFDFYSKQKVIRALADNVGLSVSLTEEDAPRTDGKILYVPKPSPDWTADEFALWEYKCYHELGHCVPGMNDVFDAAKHHEVNMKSFLGYVWNLIDDHRQEHHKHDEYEGKRKVMAKGRGLFLGTQVDSAKPDPDIDDKAAAAKALFAWDSYMRVDFQPECLSPAMKFLDILDPKTQGYYDKLMESGDRFLTRGLNAFEEYDKAKELIDYLGFDADKEEEEAKEEGGEPEDGDGEEGEGEYDKYLFHSHAESAEGEEGDEYACPTPDMRECDEYLPTEVCFPRIPQDEGSAGHYSVAIMKKGGEARGLANTIRKVMQVMSQSHYQQGLKRGKLGRNLHRSLIPESGGYGERVFKKRVTNNTLDTALTVLVDCSGSMMGDKYFCAARAALMLNDALGVTGINYSIVGFTYWGRKPQHYMFKDFKQKISTPALLEKFACTAERLGDNADGESLLWAYDTIQQQPNKRKMIITLSDGRPAAGFQPYCFEFTKRVVQSISKRGDCELYGIGIEDKTVEKLYPYNTVIRRAAELESALLNVIKNRILR